MKSNIKKTSVKKDKNGGWDNNSNRFQTELKTNESNQRVEPEAGRNRSIDYSTQSALNMPEGEVYKVARDGIKGKSDALYRSKKWNILGGVAPGVETYRNKYAQSACNRLGVEAYALDGSIAFRSERPKKNVIDHEAYHAVMQKNRPTYTRGILNRANTFSHEKSAVSFEETGKAADLRDRSQRAVPRLSFYRVRSSLRISDNNDIAVPNRRRPKEVFAKEEKINESRRQLAGQSSILSLEKGTSEREIQVGQQEPRNPVPAAPFIGGVWDQIRQGEQSSYLRLNSSGPEVSILQRALTSAGYDGSFEDGVFDAATRDALRSYQREVGNFPPRGIDGILGRDTLSVLDGTQTPYIASRALNEVVMKNLLLNVEGSNLLMLNDCGACAASIMGTLNWSALSNSRRFTDETERYQYDPYYYDPREDIESPPSYSVDGGRNRSDPHPDEPVRFDDQQTDNERELARNSRLPNTIFRWKNRYVYRNITGALRGIYSDVDGNRAVTRGGRFTSSEDSRRGPVRALEPLRYRILQDRFNMTYEEWQNPWNRNNPDRLTNQERQRLAREGEVNEHALPPVGGAYGTLYNELSDSPRGGGFHFGAVIMASGSDTVALDNYVDVDKPLFDNRWKVQMYGQAGSGSQRNQSFHSRYAQPGRVGRNAMTIAVEPGN